MFFPLPIIQTATLEKETALKEGRILKSRVAFEPSAHSLAPTFRLSRYAELRGRKSKVRPAVTLH